MGEPLKKKDIVRGLIVNADEYTEEKMIVLKKIESVWVNLENLESAVEWMKHEVNLLGLDLIQYNKLIGIIDETFQDLNTNNSKKES